LTLENSDVRLEGEPFFEEAEDELLADYFNLQFTTTSNVNQFLTQISPSLPNQTN